MAEIIFCKNGREKEEDTIERGITFVALDAKSYMVLVVVYSSECLQPSAGALGTQSANSPSTFLLPACPLFPLRHGDWSTDETNQK